jgi:hypothetical protein
VKYARARPGDAAATRNRHLLRQTDERLKFYDNIIIIVYCRRQSCVWLPSYICPSIPFTLIVRYQTGVCKWQDIMLHTRGDDNILFQTAELVKNARTVRQ